MIVFREAKDEDIKSLMNLDRQIRRDLSSKKNSYFLEPITEDELRRGLRKPSVIIMASDGIKLLGFVFLKELYDKEERVYERAFDNFKPGKALMIREIGFYPEHQKNGNCMELLRTARKYAIEHNFKQFVGALHPDDLQSQNAILTLWERGKALRFDNQCIKVTEGKRFLRQRFLLDLV